MDHARAAWPPPIWTSQHLYVQTTRLPRTHVVKGHDDQGLQTFDTQVAHSLCDNPISCTHLGLMRWRPRLCNLDILDEPRRREHHGLQHDAQLPSVRRMQQPSAQTALVQQRDPWVHIMEVSAQHSIQGIAIGKRGHVKAQLRGRTVVPAAFGRRCLRPRGVGRGLAAARGLVEALQLPSEEGENAVRAVGAVGEGGVRCWWCCPSAGDRSVVARCAA
jgi:hypothetical protein